MTKKERCREREPNTEKPTKKRGKRISMIDAEKLNIVCKNNLMLLKVIDENKE